MRVLLCAFIGCFCALPVYAMDLVEAVKAADKWDPQFSASKSQYLAGMQKYKQGQSLLLPHLNFSMNGGVEHTDSVSTSAFSKESEEKRGNKTWSYGVSAEQVIYRPAVVAESSQLKKQSELAEAQYEKARQEFLLRVVQAYFGVVSAQDKIDLVRSQKLAVKQQMDQAEKSFEVGIATIMDVHESKAKFDNIAYMEITSNNELEVKKEAFRKIVGVYPDVLKPVSDKYKPEMIKNARLPSLINQAKKDNAQVLQDNISYSIASLETKKYRLIDSPSLSLVAGYNDRRLNGDGPQSGEPSLNKSASIALQLNIPLYSGGERRSKLLEANYNKDAAWENKINSAMTAEFETKQYFMGVNSSVAQVKALTESVDSNELSVRSTKLGRDVGIRTMLDVLNSQQQYFQEKYNLIQARYEYFVNFVKLQSATGQLNTDSIVEMNSRLSNSAKVIQ